MIEQKTSGASYKDLQKATLAVVTKCVFNIPDKKTAKRLSLRYFVKKLAHDEMATPRSRDHLRSLRELRNEAYRGEFENVVPHFEQIYKEKNPDWRNPEDTVERGIGIAFRNLAQALS
ncbi:MAG: hypothetical protein WCV81_00240 [Microgenomates group bacterium]|jgi:hypothetical protein